MTDMCPYAISYMPALMP